MEILSLSGMPVIVKVLGSLFLILFLGRLLRQLILPLAAGTVFLAFSIGCPVQEMFRVSLDSATSINNLLLMLAFVLVLCLSAQMSASGALNEIVGMIRPRIPHRMSFAAMPALIGFLPMPGGALFSAPFVDSCDKDNSVDPADKSVINYWFRHIWEYGWPLFPGVLLAIELSHLETWQFMLVNLPLCICSIATGYFLLLRRIKPVQNDSLNEKETPAAPFDGLRFLKLLSPIIFILIFYPLIKIFLPEIGRTSKYLPLSIGIMVAIAALQLMDPIGLDKWRKIIFSKTNMNVLLLVLIVRIYGSFMESRLPDGTLLVAKMHMEMMDFGIPALAFTILIPFICGITTGIGIGFVGASFPVVISLLGSDPPMKDLVPTTMLAFGSGYLGMMLSPVHICLVVSNAHFKARLSHSFRLMLPPASIMMAVTILYYFILRLAL